MLSIKTPALLGALGLLIAGVSGISAAQANDDPIAKGTAIAKEWDARDIGFGDTTSVMKMVLINRHGQKSTREMRQKVMEVPAEDRGDKSIIVFDHPRDVKGTAFLTHAKILDADDQWLYLPALKRVKRISSKNKSGPFVGSEFAYEDISAREFGKYSYTYLRDEACGDGLECFVLEQKPLYERSGYTKQIAWYDKKDYRQIKIDFYDRKEELLKTLKYSKYEKFLDKFWRPGQMDMVNHQTGKSTILIFENYKFNNGLTDRDFRKNVLERVR